jgi:endoglucanase
MKKKSALILTILMLIFNTIAVNAGQQLGQIDFEKVKGDPWQIVESGGGDLNFDVSGGTFNITINNPGGKNNGGEDRWDCQFRHRDLTIVKGHHYAIKWSIFPSADGVIYTKIGNQDGSVEVWHNNATDPTAEEFENSWESIPVKANEWNVFESGFTAGETVENAEWTFHFGGAGEYQKVDCFPVGTVLKFDNMSLIDETSDDNDYKEEEKAPKNKIRINQVGYFPNLEKKAILVVEEGDDEPKEFTLENGGEVLYKGNSEPYGFDADSGEYLHIIDFSGYVPADGDVKSVDSYTIYCEKTRSYVFSIKDNIYTNDVSSYSIPGSLLRDSFNYFYQNRSGIDIESEYITSASSDKLARKAGHSPDIAYIQKDWINSYSSESAVDKSNEIDITGGWYDAGDFGKYIVNGGISVWTLNNMYEFALNNGTENVYAENSDIGLLLPENNNGIPDILDETKYEMEFFLKMVVTDGELKNMVYHKAHDYTWSGLAIHPSDANLTRIVKPPSTAATLNFAAAAAQTARLLKPFSFVSSEKYLTQAAASYAAAKAHPDLLAPMNQAIGGGAYGDTNVSDEFYWAACELYASTGEEQYLTDLKSYEKALQTITSLNGGENSGSFSSFNWGNVSSLGNLTLYLNQEELAVLTKNDSETLEQSIISAADTYLAAERKQGYALPYKGTNFTDENNAPGQSFTGYEWGSNSFVMNNAIVLSYAYNLTHSGGYLNGVVNATNYILGMNALDNSFVTRYGTKTSLNPHHRYWANSLDASFPQAPAGVLVGGPNSGMVDPFIQSMGIPSDTPPQLCYVDNIEAWSVNECTINWNSPLAWVVGFLDTNASSYDPNVPVPEPETTEQPALKTENEDDGNKSLIVIIIVVAILLTAIVAAVLLQKGKTTDKKTEDYNKKAKSKVEKVSNKSVNSEEIFSDISDKNSEDKVQESEKTKDVLKKENDTANPDENSEKSINTAESSKDSFKKEDDAVNPDENSEKSENNTDKAMVKSDVNSKDKSDKKSKNPKVQKIKNKSDKTE